MAHPSVNIARKPSPHSLKHRLGRVLWAIVYRLLFRLSLKPMHRWRVLLLKLFGADVSWRARVHCRTKIWAPWNLRMEDYATLADDVDCYCVAPISIGAHTTVSQYSYLCAATHDFEHPNFILVPRAITIGRECWVAADVFVGPGVTIGDGAVVGARSGVFSDLPPWMVCAGTPARPLRDRVIATDSDSSRAVQQ